MLFNAAEKSERLNLPDTLKCQHTAKLTAGHCLYSDMGRVLAAIVADTCGWHRQHRRRIECAKKCTRSTVQAAIRNCATRFYRNGTDNLLVELGKWGLGISDLLMTLNLFSRVDVDRRGRVELRRRQFEGRRLRRAVCADEHARRAHRDPASARPEPRIRAQAGQARAEHRPSARSPNSAARRVRKTCAASSTPIASFSERTDTMTTTLTVSNSPEARGLSAKRLPRVNRGSRK